MVKKRTNVKFGGLTITTERDTGKKASKHESPGFNDLRKRTSGLCLISFVRPILEGHLLKDNSYYGNLWISEPIGRQAWWHVCGLLELAVKTSQAEPKLSGTKETQQKHSALPEVVFAHSLSLSLSLFTYMRHCLRICFSLQTLTEVKIPGEPREQLCFSTFHVCLFVRFDIARLVPQVSKTKKNISWSNPRHHVM